MFSIQRHFFIRNKINATWRPRGSTKNVVTSARLKGTFLENWAKYWKGLYADYKEVAVDTVKGCKERPIRASVYTLLLGGGFYCCRSNPDEKSFHEALMQNTMRLMFVGESNRNPSSMQHVLHLEECLNEKTVRRMNLGIVSLIWLDNYSDLLALYKARCSYLKPEFRTFYERIVDIGFLNRWWILEKKMQNYDINELEFAMTDSPV